MTEYTPTDLAAQLKSGLLSFPVTHFADDLSFDEAGYRKHLAWLAQYPVAGLFAAGGTGEGFSLTLEETDQVVGIHMIGPDAPEILQAAAIAVKAGLTKKQFDETIALHPTMSEELVLMR